MGWTREDSFHYEKAKSSDGRGDRAIDGGLTCDLRYGVFRRQRQWRDDDQVALETQDSPYSYADKDGNPTGFDLDVLKQLDEELPDYKFDYDLVDYQTALVGTKQGKYNALIGAFFKTDARAKEYLLSKPYDYFFVNLIVPEESPINKLEDLDGKTLDPIVPTDGRYVAIHDWLKRHPDVNITVPEVTNQSTFQDMFNSVHDGSYDAVYLSKAQYEGVADTLGYNLKMIPACTASAEGAGRLGV